MARRYQKDSNTIEYLITSLSALYFLYLATLWFTNKSKFYQGVIYYVLLFIILAAIAILWSVLKTRRKKKKLSDLLSSIQQTGTEETINNFINSFGNQKKSEKNLWKYQGYTFTWDQMDSFRRTLHDKGVHVSITDNYKDISILLRHYIYHKEDKFVRDSIANKNHAFSALNPTQFENLLCRLYEAMGYSVKKTGRTGDQGCDLVVNMGDQRTVIQAKRYNGSSVGNAAVQEAVGALKMYNCAKAIVVATSSFTLEAVQLAKVNNVGLVGKERLRELLLEFLKESWS